MGKLSMKAGVKELDIKRETILMFIGFLKQHKCFAAYVRNVLYYNNDDLRIKSIYSAAVREKLIERLRLCGEDNFISGTFLWADDEYKLWAALSIKWQQELRVFEDVGE